MKQGERARFHQHLQACPICQQQLEDLQALRQDMHALPTLTLWFDLSSRLEGRLQRQPQRHHGARIRPGSCGRTICGRRALLTVERNRHIFATAPDRTSTDAEQAAIGDLQ